MVIDQNPTALSLFDKEAKLTLQKLPVISWHFNHSLKKLHDKMPESNAGYYYGKRFSDARSVMDFRAKHFEQLHKLIRLWQSTYYDSSLLHWLLERSIINIGTIATVNTYRFATVRFWG